MLDLVDEPVVVTYVGKAPGGEGNGAENGNGRKAVRLDIRDAEQRHFEGFDAVIHLAAISNDPLGDYRPEVKKKRRKPSFEGGAAVQQMAREEKERP